MKKEQKVRFISKEELLEMMENKESFALVEVLAKDEYEKGHLPSAINIPVGDLEALSPRLLPNKEARIVVYCASFLCSASSGAARALQSLGYADVADYKGGKADWRAAGLPFVQS